MNPFRIFVLKYESVLNSWNVNPPEQKYETLFDFGRMMAELIGIRTFSDMKRYWLTATTAVLVSINLSTTFYTFQYYVRRNAFKRAIECTCFIPITTLVSDHVYFLLNQFF